MAIFALREQEKLESKLKVLESNRTESDTVSGSCKNCTDNAEGKDTNVFTNADHIRSMTDEDLGDFLDGIYCLGWSHGAADKMGSDPDYHEWLKQPYKEAT